MKELPNRETEKERYITEIPKRGTLKERNIETEKWDREREIAKRYLKRRQRKTARKRKNNVYFYVLLKCLQFSYKRR